MWFEDFWQGFVEGFIEALENTLPIVIFYIFIEKFFLYGFYQ